MAENVNGNDELENAPVPINGNQIQGHRIELDFSPNEEPAVEAEPAVEDIEVEDADFDIPDFRIPDFTTEAISDEVETASFADSKAETDSFNIGESPIKSAEDTAPLFDAAEYAPKKKRLISDLLKAGNAKIVACLLGVCLIGAVSVAAGSVIGNKQAEQAANPAIEIATPDNGRTDANGTGTAESAQDADNDVIDDSIATLPSTEESQNAEDGETVSTDDEATSESTDKEESDESDGDDATDEECDHDWEPYKAKKETIAAKTHTEKIPATYETVTEYHTVCNTCKQKIDGKTKEHAAETGHEGYTTNVPISVTKVKTKASTKTIVDTPAKVKTTWTKEKCSKCKEVRKLDEEKSKTKNKED